MGLLFLHLLPLFSHDTFLLQLDVRQVPEIYIIIEHYENLQTKRSHENVLHKIVQFAFCMSSCSVVVCIKQTTLCWQWYIACVQYKSVPFALHGTTVLRNGD